MIQHVVSEMKLVELSAVFLFLFALVGAFDGIYFHLIKFKLHLNPQSRLEHAIHTLRAFLLAPIVYFLFERNNVGLSLLIGVFFVVVDFSVEVVDILVEKNSRANIGGISPEEYIAHVAATSFRLAAIALLLVSKPMEAYSLQSQTLAQEVYPVILTQFSRLFAFTSIAGGILSVAMMQRKPAGSTKRATHPRLATHS